MDRSSERRVLCFLNLVVFALVVALVSGCGAARAGRFEAFAAAGMNYAQARNQFLRQSLDVNIERDTLELRKQHGALDAAGRARVLTEQDKIVQERIAILADLERHGAVLNQYFLALARLASTQADANAAAAATRLSGELGGLTDALSKKSIGGTALSERVGQVTGMAVGGFRNRALERHLKEHARTVQRELALEEGLLRVLTDEMIADRKVLQANERRTVLVPPFRGDTPPPEWDAERKRFLLAEVDLTRARAAQDAARYLRMVFESLAGGADDGGLAALQSAIERVNQFIGPGGK
jgi:nicotinamide mononucleotide (NMN) deamidase PncC